MRIAAALSLALLAILPNGGSLAQSYPNRPITLIIPSAPGGLLDGFAKLIGDQLQSAWGQPAVMEHRPGAGGLIGTDIAARAAPDGHTLLMGNIGPLAIGPSLYRKVPYDVMRDIAPVSLFATYPNVLVVNPNFPAKTVGDLIKLAKEKPGSLNFASSGIGQSHHVSGEMFKQLTGIDIVHVPYKGTGPAITDLLGGQVEMMFSNLPPVLPHIESGGLRALGVTSATRNAALPNIPTIQESGVAGYDVVSWAGVVAPSKTPKEVIARLNQEIAKAMTSPFAKKLLEQQGAEFPNLSPEQFGAFMQAELDKWAKVIRAANVSID